MQANINTLEEFKKHFEEYNNNSKDEIAAAKAEIDAFLDEYPLERIKTLTPEEYCLGTDNSKNSLSYQIEFGKYKHTGFGIGGGSSLKHGVFYSRKENSYRHSFDAIDDIDEFWPLFRDDLYRFLIESGEGAKPLKLKDYPRLKGMAMVLTKLLCIYFPEKYITIGSKSVLKKLMDKFEYPYEDSMRCNELNFYFNQDIRSDFPECANASGQVIGAVAWSFIDGENEKLSRRTEKEDGIEDEEIEETQYWMYSPGRNASKWDDYYKQGIMAIGWGMLGDLTEYDSKTEIQEKMKQEGDPSKSYKMDSLATWQFVDKMKPGDVIYAKKGRQTIIGRGIVDSDYYYDDSSKEDDHYHFRKVKWTNSGEWEHPSGSQAVMKTLTDITAYTEYVQKLEDLFIDEESEDIEEEPEKKWPSYSKEQFLEKVYMDEKNYNTLVSLINKKKNVILQGAPGVGKTFAANRLAYSIMGEMNKDRVMMVQFHQSYSYEDFIEGFRPSSDNNGFEIKKGSFYKFCKKAADDGDNKYFFIIDEINRGNLSKIFGELFMLIEKDKRGNSLQLLYSDEKFFVPKNVYIIGMMNTADRSLAMLDYALRRRFSFFDMKPAFDQEKFIEYREGLNSEKFNKLIACVKDLNKKIAEDSTLGEGFCIGHSYFCELTEASDDALINIVEYELIPLLREYWFDDPSKVAEWSDKLRRSIR